MMMMMMMTVVMTMMKMRLTENSCYRQPLTHPSDALLGTRNGGWKAHLKPVVCWYDYEDDDDRSDVHHCFFFRKEEVEGVVE